MIETDAVEAGRRTIVTLLKLTRPLSLSEIAEQVERPEAAVITDLDWLVGAATIRVTGSQPQHWTV